jgi:hypothetical protein
MKWGAGTGWSLSNETELIFETQVIEMTTLAKRGSRTSLSLRRFF